MLKENLNQIKSNYKYSNIITKETAKELLLSIRSKSFCSSWKNSFNETYEEFVDKLLNNDSISN